MTIRLTKPFHKAYRKLPVTIQKKVDRQLKLLETNLSHPGLQSRKMVNKANIWEARVNGHYRFTFQIQGDEFILRKVGTHEIYRKP